MRVLVLVVVAACAPSVRQLQQTAGAKNARAYNDALSAWRVSHPDARELAGQYVALGEAHLEDAEVPEAVVRQLVVSPPRCPTSCTSCDRGTLGAFYVFAMSDGSVTVLRMKPRVHAIKVRGEGCESSCGVQLVDAPTPLRYPVTMPATIRYEDVGYEYETISEVKPRCPGPPPP